MVTPRSTRVPALFSFATALLGASPLFAATWQTNVSYGASTRMDLYVPDQRATPSPIVVVLHYCGGSATNAHGWLQTYSDQYGFILITPQAGGSCFDAAATRAGERANVVSMVDYAVMQSGGDRTRVFSVGASSGACMTQALLAAYPEVFIAGSSLAGVPAGAWTGGNSYAWSTAGTSGGPAWGDKVRNAHPDYTGARPRVQLWHGQGDTNLTYSQSYPAQVAQWTNVLGVTDANATTEMIRPSGATDTWARTSYRNGSGGVVVEANSGPSSVPHDLTGRGLWRDVVRFFALDMTGSSGAGGTGGMAGSGSAGRAAGGRGGGGGTGMGNGGAGSSAGGVGGSVGGVGNGGSDAGSSAGGVAGTGVAGAVTGGTATGGATATGGGTSIGGTSGTGATPDPSDDAPAEDGGCACRVSPESANAARMPLTALGLAMLGFLLRRRRR